MINGLLLLWVDYINLQSFVCLKQIYEIWGLCLSAKMGVVLKEDKKKTLTVMMADNACDWGSFREMFKTCKKL